MLIQTNTAHVIAARTASTVSSAALDNVPRGSEPHLGEHSVTLSGSRQPDLGRRVLGVLAAAGICATSAAIGSSATIASGFPGILKASYLVGIGGAGVGYLLARALGADEDSRARITTGAAMGAIGSLAGGAVFGLVGSPGAASAVFGGLTLIVGTGYVMDGLSS